MSHLGILRSLSHDELMDRIRKLEESIDSACAILSVLAARDGGKLRVSTGDYFDARKHRLTIEQDHCYREMVVTTTWEPERGMPIVDRTLSLHKNNDTRSHDGK